MKPWVTGLGHCSALYDPPRKAVNHLFNKGRSTNVVTHAYIILEFGRLRQEDCWFQGQPGLQIELQSQHGLLFFFFFYKKENRKKKKVGQDGLCNGGGGRPWLSLNQKVNQPLSVSLNTLPNTGHCHSFNFCPLGRYISLLCQCEFLYFFWTNTPANQPKYNFYNAQC